MSASSVWVAASIMNDRHTATTRIKPYTVYVVRNCIGSVTATQQFRRFSYKYTRKSSISSCSNVIAKFLEMCTASMPM